MGLRVCSPKKLVVCESLRFVNLGKEGMGLREVLRTMSYLRCVTMV